jgi:hypothetical protein
MISMKVLSTAAAMAVFLPMAAPTPSFAQNQYGVRGGGGAGVRAGAVRPGGGGGTLRQGGGAGLRVGGGGAPAARFSGGGGGYRGGYDRGYRRDGGGGFVPGAVAGAVTGAVVGGAIASGGYGYYGDPGYYYGAGYDAPGYYDDQYDDEGAVAAVPAPVGDGVGYCMQTYRSYDPASGTYLGYDGLRHPCP